MTDDREKVIILIKKLLNMAEHANSNEHEALVAARQAESLMRKYNIDYAEAIAKEIKTGAGMTTVDSVATAKDNGTPTLKTPMWAQQLAVRVANLFDAPVRLTSVKDAKGRWEQGLRFHGYEHDVRVAKWTFDLLVAAINKVCKDYRKNPHYLDRGRTVMNAYRFGVVHSVLNTINDMIAEKMIAETSGSMALVEYTTPVKPTSVLDRHAYHSGREDGREIRVKTAIEQSSTSKQLAS